MAQTTARDDVRRVGTQAVRGIVQADAKSTLSSELAARIVELPFRPGQSFRAGDLLVAFDCAKHEADLRAAKAQQKAAAITLRQNKHLLKFRAGGQSDAEIAEARHDEMSAAVDGMAVQLRGCKIIAPFDGRIAKRYVHRHETPQANAPLLDIVKEGELMLELIVPSRWTTWLQPGQTFAFRVDETGTEHAAVVTELGAVVDPISRTITVYGRLQDASEMIRPGMSGEALLAPPQG